MKRKIKNKVTKEVEIRSIKITPAQSKCIEKMRVGISYSAYDLQVSVSTLNALHSKGVLNKQTHSGYIWSPRTALRYKIVT